MGKDVTNLHTALNLHNVLPRSVTIRDTRSKLSALSASILAHVAVITLVLLFVRFAVPDAESYDRPLSVTVAAHVINRASTTAAEKNIVTTKVQHRKKLLPAPKQPLMRSRSGETALQPAKHVVASAVQSGSRDPAPATNARIDGAKVSSTSSPSDQLHQQAAGSLPDFVPQYKITIAPVIPIQEIQSRIQYPRLAAREGIQATVFVELYIDQAGQVRRVDVLKDPGYGFAQAAVQALEGIVCKPAQLDGHPVGVRFRFPVQFELR